MIEYGSFLSHSGLMLPWKIDCDSLSHEDLEGLASIINHKFIFSRVIGIPQGGLRLASHLRKYEKENYPILIVDDVLSTGKSMEDMKSKIGDPVVGVVIYARGKIPNWIWPIFTVNDWTQTRGTGIG